MAWTTGLGKVYQIWAPDSLGYGMDYSPVEQAAEINQNQDCGGGEGN